MSMATFVHPSEEISRVHDESAAGQQRLTALDHTALATAADLHTLTRITQIWSERLQLISVYSSFFTSIDSLLFSLASSKNRDSTASRLMLASLVGALIFHAAAGSAFGQKAILAYVASFVLIRYKLNDEQSTSGSSDSMITAVYAKYPHSVPISAGQPQTPSVLESGKSGPREKVHNTRAFTSLSATSFFFGWPPFLSTLTTGLGSLLDEPPSLKIDLRRVSMFGSMVPRFPTPVHDGNSKDAEKNMKALMRLLGRCHGVCSIFALSGFILVITGVIAYVWAVLERSVAIFGSACVGACIILGLAALL
ncbi:hypothetical protein BC827DRAFT_1322744 [Russula dissimulans]|nr:hypothetical protein BC827DRAFT_1322744 [Russula dissimulans]